MTDQPTRPAMTMREIRLALGHNVEPDAARQTEQQPDEDVEETHVVADDSDNPEHIDDCPGCETAAELTTTRTIEETDQ